MDYKKKYERALALAKSYYDKDTNEFLDTIFPELVRSEEDMMIDAIRSVIGESHIVSFNDISREMMIAWLEKQKEQKPHQEVLSDSVKRMLDYHASLVRGGERKPFAHENDFVSEPKSYIEDAANNYAKNFGDKGGELYTEIFDAYKAGAYYAELRQKPAEWSEEDEKNWQSYIERLESEYRKAPNVVLWDDINWLKSLHERLESLRSQPKQVWTEEDNRICHLIMANLSESARHAITLPMETVNDFNNWLRTLQCMPPVFTDWNEEDQTLLSDALGCVTMVQELKKRGKLKNFCISCTPDELRSWIRSLKSRPRKQPSWKPSEEQSPERIESDRDIY